MYQKLEYKSTFTFSSLSHNLTIYKKYFSNITEVTTKFQNSKKATAQFFSLSLEVEIFYAIASALDIADKFYLIRDTHHPTCIIVVSS